MELPSQFSDGVKAFTGLVAFLMSSDCRIILIDEPELCLHPPLAKKLGRISADLAFKRQGNVFGSTHSAYFLMGCIQSGRGVNVVRLTYNEDIATARLLSSSKLKSMMKDPLVRSSGVLSALFHRGCIVTESDADRAFYQEINERLLSSDSGGDECIFLNAQNKQTVRRIVSPLREMGVPAAAVIDLDIVKESSGLKDLLKSCSVPQCLVNAWGALRGEIKSKFEGKNIDPSRQGIDGLGPKDRESAEIWLENLKEYGIFVVPGGALESWLPDLGADGHGSNWLVSAFEKMGTSPDEEGYLSPSQGDVWDFVRNIASWISNPNRKGMP